jgi:hypothetical protein
MVVHAIFDKNRGCVAFDHQPEACTPHHTYISGGDHFLVKNPLVLAFGIIENGHSCYFQEKWALCGH